MDYLDELKSIVMGVEKDLNDAMQIMPNMQCLSDPRLPYAHITSAMCGISYITREIEKIEALDEMEATPKGS